MRLSFVVVIMFTLFKLPSRSRVGDLGLVQYFLLYNTYYVFRNKLCTVFDSDKRAFAIAITFYIFPFNPYSFYLSLFQVYYSIKYDEYFLNGLQQLENHSTQGFPQDWFKNIYSTDNKKVNLNKTNSKLLSIDRWVLRWSNIGPSNLYYSQVIYSKVPHAQFVLFAGDTFSFISNLCLHSLVQRANAALSNVKIWLSNNLQTWNQQKTEFIFHYCSPTTTT